MTTSRTDTAPANPPSRVSSELLDYLHTMITPTQIGGETLVTMDLGSIAWDTLADETYHGLIAMGTPTEEQVEHIWRVVKPGAHVMLIAPDDCTTGYLGACALEDRGFEIRDAILVVDEPGHLYYVPKSNGKERNAGTEHLAVKRNGPPLYSLSEEAQQDEAALADLEAALADKNASNQELLDMVDAVLEGSSGIPRDNIPKDYRHLFEKQENLGKYGNNHPCLHPDATVMTPTGHRPITTLKVGDLVYSADGRFHAITDVSSHRYTSPALFQISVFGSNLSTLASDNHPFLVWRPARTKKGNVTGGVVSWVEAQDLRKGDYTMTPILEGKPFEDAPTVDLEGYANDLSFWFILGLYVAEGVAQSAGHGDNVYPSFSLHENETSLVARIRAFFEPRVKVSVYPKGDSHGIQVMAFDPRVGAMFRTLCGSGATTKVLHPIVWDLSRQNQQALFEGYIAGDGGNVRTYLQAKTSSPLLASQLRHLGEALGFRCNHNRFKAKPGSIQGRAFKQTSDENHLQFYSLNTTNTHRRPSRPMHLVHEGVRYVLSYVKEPVKVSYEGDVWNLSVEGNPTFQTVVGMSHNTVKPKDVMKALLAGVPKNKVILDPFMGSGTTGLACLETGHDFIGIEREPEYINIADARVRHWAHGWARVDIESEAPGVATNLVREVPVHGGVFDMFGEDE